VSKDRRSSASGGDEPEIVVPDNALAGKVGRREGEAPDAGFRAAAAAIDEQAIDFIGRVRSDIEEVRCALDIASGNDGRREAAIDRVFALVHNMKGQGTTFGYPLVSQIGALVCSMLQRGQPVDDARLRVVKAHIDALDLVIEHNLVGTGGPLGTKLVDRLEKLAASAV